MYETRNREMEQLANMKFYFKLGESGSETYKSLKAVYGKECMTRREVLNWFERYCDNSEDLESEIGLPPSKNRYYEGNKEIVEEISDMISEANRTLNENLNNDLRKLKRLPSDVGRKRNMEQRANIKFCSKLGKNGVETYKMLKHVYGDKCMSRAQVFRWFGRFRDGRESLDDDNRPPPPKTARNEQNIMKIKDMLQTDGFVSVRFIEEKTGIARSTAYRILTKDLDKRKIHSSHDSEFD